jgi:stage V sporulation protein R
MAADYDLDELERWDERIREKVQEIGLDCFPQEFEVCDHSEMLGYMAYSGMPSHYPHWSYGKAYEKLKTLYDYGVSGLPYEMVINSNPALAYLMRDNSLLLQILTMAHVYGHNDFFKSNFTFSTTRPEHTISRVKAQGSRVRGYIADPSSGIDKVEAILDAAHAVSLQCRRNLSVRKLSPEEQRTVALETAKPPEDPFRKIHRRVEYQEPDLRRVPLEPDEDLLLFIRDHNPHYSEWEKDLLTIVHESAQYFIPQIETKIMNEGWATYWHKRILDSLELPQELQIEFIVRHNQVVRPTSGGLNPYHLGLRVWEDIYRKHENPDEADEKPTGSGEEALFEARRVDRDTSFLRRHLTERLIRQLNLFEYREQGENLVVSEVAGRDGWRQIKETLIKSVGMSSVPVIRVVDCDFGQNHTLYLAHDHDGRDLQLEYAEKTLAFIYRLWHRDVALETTIDGSRTLLRFGEQGFASKALK